MTRHALTSILESTVLATNMRRLPVLFVLAGVLFATSPLRTEPNVAISVTPHTAFAPATVIITVTIEPDANNRELVVEADSDAYYRRSEMSLEGDNAARTHRLMFRGLPAGEYQISAAVGGSTGQRAAVRTTVTVVGE
jgi:hypothetical protein